MLRDYIAAVHETARDSCPSRRTFEGEPGSELTRRGIPRLAECDAMEERGLRSP